MICIHDMYTNNITVLHRVQQANTKQSYTHTHMHSDYISFIIHLDLSGGLTYSHTGICTNDKFMTMLVNSLYKPGPLREKSTLSVLTGRMPSSGKTSVLRTSFGTPYMTPEC